MTQQKPEIMQTPTDAATPTQQTAPSPGFESNPFLLAFNALGRLFNTNATWAIALVILGAVSAVISLPGDASSEKSSDEQVIRRVSETLSQYDTMTLLGMALGVALVLGIIATISYAIQIFVGGLFAYVALESEKGRSVSFNEAFDAVKKRFKRLFLAQGFAGIKIFLWTLLFIIPGIIASLRYALLPYIIMDESEKETKITASHDRVKSIVKGRLFEIFGLGVAAGIIPIMNSVLQVSGGAAQYRQLASSYDNKTARPPIHWVNYLLLALLVILCVAFIALMVVLVVVFAAFS